MDIIYKLLYANNKSTMTAKALAFNKKEAFCGLLPQYTAVSEITSQNVYIPLPDRNI